jgi:hypothetical protein
VSEKGKISSDKNRVFRNVKVGYDSYDKVNLIPHKNTNVKKRPSSYPKMSALKSGEIRKLKPSLHSQLFVSAENAGSQFLQLSLNFNLAMFFLLKLIPT